MPATIGAGPLLSPWVRVWDLVWQSPETWLVVASAVIGLTLGGAALTFIGRGRQAQAGAPRSTPENKQSRPGFSYQRHLPIGKRRRMLSASVLKWSASWQPVWRPPPADFR